jgi:RecB family endonuclease NucS
MIGRITRVPLREVWKHEALDFTKWFEENIEVLNETIGFRLENTERERSDEDFSVDIVAEDENGDTVIIENQLGKSDHDHLGKIITYLTAFGAKIPIWIVKPHRQSILPLFNGFIR